MSDSSIKILSLEEQLQQRLVKTNHKLYMTELELKAYKEDPATNGYKGCPGYTPSMRLQMKVDSQRKALHSLNRRIRVQRLILRELALQDETRANDLYHLVMDKYAVELGEDTGLSL